MLKLDLAKIAQEQNYFDDIANILLNRFPNSMNYSDALQIGKELVQYENFSKEDIKLGKADESISERLMIFGIKSKSVHKENESQPKIEMKTKKIKVLIVSIGVAITMFVTASAGKAIVDYHIKNEVQHELDLVNGEHNIVDDHKYTVWEYPGLPSLDERGDPYIDYNVNDIAEDIINICKKDPKQDVLKMCLGTSYEIFENRLVMTDALLSNLKFQTSNNPELSFIYDQLVDYDSILDYMKGDTIYLVEEEEKEIDNAIQHYKELERQGVNVPFNSLSKEDQRVIKNLIDHFNVKLKFDYKEFYKELKNQPETVELEPQIMEYPTIEIDESSSRGK